MTLDGLTFDNLLFSPFVVIFVRANASVRPRISDVIAIHESVKEDVFEFIGVRCTKNCMVLCESHQ